MGSWIFGSDPARLVKRKRALFWQELLFKHTQFQIPKDAIIQVWMKPTDLATVVKQGYQGILSAGLFNEKYFNN